MEEIGRLKQTIFSIKKDMIGEQAKKDKELDSLKKDILSIKESLKKKQAKDEGRMGNLKEGTLNMSVVAKEGDAGDFIQRDKDEVEIDQVKNDFHYIRDKFEHNNENT
mmetsp:Transcript_39117/g.57116  ORF Transcript_39117/g.57116 Transcript_39117/m.57116 type:complete len:108 (+) Transcript_39117:13-336(+)